MCFDYLKLFISLTGLNILPSLWGQVKRSVTPIAFWNKALETGVLIEIEKDNNILKEQNNEGVFFQRVFVFLNFIKSFISL